MSGWKMPAAKAANRSPPDWKVVNLPKPSEYLTKGTNYMRPRPVFDPALEENKENLPEITREPMEYPQRCIGHSVGTHALTNAAPNSVKMQVYPSGIGVRLSPSIMFRKIKCSRYSFTFRGYANLLATVSNRNMPGRRSQIL